MRWIYTIILGWLLADNVLAQTLNRSNFPVIGDNFGVGTNSSIIQLDAGAGGTNQNWDFSSITTESIDSAYVKDPITISEGEQFPDANAAIETIDGTLFLNVTNDDINQIGAIADPGVGQFVAFRHKKPLKFFVFPISYGTTFSDSTVFLDSLADASGISQGLIDSAHIIRYVRRELIVDATGTLKIEAGTYTNCLRIKTIEYSLDSTYFKGGVIGQNWVAGLPSFGIPAARLDTTTSYDWWNDSYKFPLFSVDINSRDTVTNLEFKPVAISGRNATLNHTTVVFPNPTTGTVKISWEKPLATPAKMHVMTLDGRIIYSHEINAQATECLISLPQSIQNGCYRAVIESLSGKLLIEKPIILGR